MITLKDCIAFCDLDPATVVRVARHENLPELVAFASARAKRMRSNQSLDERLDRCPTAHYRAGADPLCLAA